MEGKETEENKVVDDQNKTDDAGKTENKTDPKESTKQSERTFTQDQVSRMMTKEKNQGRNAVYNDLGLDPNNEDLVKSVKDYIASQKTSEQKAIESHDAEIAKIAEAERRAQIAEAKAEIMMMGIKPQFVEDAVTLMLAKTSDDTLNLKESVSELKAKYPVWFTDDEDDKKNVGQKGTGSTPKSQSDSKDGDDIGKTLGARLAAQRTKGTGTKKSYWSN